MKKIKLIPTLLFLFVLLLSSPMVKAGDTEQYVNDKDKQECNHPGKFSAASKRFAKRFTDKDKSGCNHPGKFSAASKRFAKKFVNKKDYARAYRSKLRNPRLNIPPKPEDYR